MLNSHFKFAWRNITRHKTFAIINMLGLSLGICACIVIYLIVNYEFSFDTFHPGRERIYRLRGDVTENSGNKVRLAKIPPAVSLNGRSEIPGMESITTVVQYNVKVSLPGTNPVKSFENNIRDRSQQTTVITDTRYFNIFKYNWLAGNPATALETPFKVVLTESKAHQYFGLISLDEVIGKQLMYEDSLLVTVAGIISDQDKNTDLFFTDFISFATIQSSFLKNSINLDSWKQGDMSAWVFTKLSKDISAAQVSTQFNALVSKYGDPKTKLALWLEPLAAIHFNADVIENPIRVAHKPTLYSLMGVALFILILAIVNFINLSTAESIQRAREMGVRKILGSSRTNLVLQFLAETLLIILFSVLLAVLFVNPVLTGFRSFIPDGVTFHFFETRTILFLSGLVLLVTIMAGLYPARIVSSKQPSLNLKGQGVKGSSRQWLLRKGLIVFQFSVSLVFIIGSIIMANQIRYTREKDLGFVSDAIITVETPRGGSRNNIQVFAEQVRQVPEINTVALQWTSPMTENGRGMQLKFKRNDEKDFAVGQIAGDENFIPLYQIKLLAGRNLVKSDTVKEFVINESLVQFMGYTRPEESLDKIVYWNDKPYPIVGVVADFHASSFHDAIRPLCIINRPEREGTLAIKLASKGKHPGAIKSTIGHIEKLWKQIYPAADFNYSFYEESLANLYKKDQQTVTLVNASMLVTVFISCIGLFGLVLFIVGKRAKEISIRKVLGASVVNIVTMLSRDFAVLVLIALLIASPIAWYFISLWLRDFAYHVPVNWWMFIIAGTAMILVTLLTISFQSIKAAIINPIKALRTE